MADWQRKFARDAALRVFLRKGNKVGGTTIIHWSIKTFFDGHHPHWKRPVGPAIVCYLVADLASSYKRDISPRLREFFTDADLSDRCYYDNAKGFMVGGGRGLETRNGDQIAFFSGNQATLALSGTSGHLIVVNEPPRKHIWAEAMRAAAEFGAPVIVNFTPLPPESLVGGDDLVWLKKEIEAPEKGWSQHVVPLTYENASHRTPASIDRQIADMYAWERAQRQGAAWEGPAPARSIANWTDTQRWSGEEWSDLPGIGDVEIRLGLGADHGEIGGHEVISLNAWIGRGRECHWYVIDEYESPERTTTKQDAAGVLAMLARRGLTWGMIDEARGDVNSAGKNSKTSVNEELTYELNKQSGVQGPRFRNAEKGPGSVALGVHIINDALGNDRFWIHDRCEKTQRACRKWEGDDDKFKHWIDKLRYIAVPHLDPKRTTAPRWIGLR